jgi:DNA-binding MarR family transcriptional regulator
MPSRAADPRRPDAGTSDPDTVVNAVLTASRLLVAISARSLASVEETLTLPQFRMLVVLASRGATSISRLAAHLGVNPSTALRMIERLTTAGMVRRDTHADDRREVLLTLTPAGQAVVDEVTARRREEITGIVGRLPADERGNLVRALSAFAEAGGEPPVPSPTEIW